MAQHLPRNMAAQHRNIRLQNEIDMLQQKVSRLEDLSPRIIDVANRTMSYSSQANTNIHRYFEKLVYIRTKWSGEQCDAMGRSGQCVNYN